MCALNSRSVLCGISTIYIRQELFFVAPKFSIVSFYKRFIMSKDLFDSILVTQSYLIFMMITLTLNIDFALLFQNTRTNDSHVICTSVRAPLCLVLFWDFDTNKSTYYCHVLQYTIIFIFCSTWETEIHFGTYQTQKRHSHNIFLGGFLVT